MFKNATLLKIKAEGFEITAPVLEAAAQDNLFVPCGLTEVRSVGWSPVRNEEHGALVESVGGHLFMRLIIETRSVPARAINKLVDEKCKQIEISMGRQPGKKEKRDYKEEARLTLLPNAFPTSSSVMVWIDPATGNLIIDSSVQSRVDDVVTQLVRLTEGLSITRINTQKSPSQVMSAWLYDEDQISYLFKVGRNCALKACDETRAKVRYTNHDLSGQEVKEHIQKGKFAHSLEMVYNERVSFTLNETGALTNLDILDVVFVEKTDSAVDMFDANAAIFTGEMCKLIPDMLLALGGVINEAG